MSTEFFPWLDTMPVLDAVIQTGLNVVGAVVGQPFNVYRRTAATNVSVIAGTPLFTNFPADIAKYQKKSAIWGATFELLTFVLNGTNQPLALGDLLVTQGYKSDGGVYCIGQIEPMKETILLSVPYTCAITRPMPTAGQAAQLPAQGPAIIEGYGGYQKDTEQVLTLQNGRYAFSSLAGVSPASVQVGIAQDKRIRDGKEPDWPTLPYREHFLVAIPPTPGEELNEKDIITAENGDRYVVMSILQQPAGLLFWICICERKAV